MNAFILLQAITVGATDSTAKAVTTTVTQPAASLNLFDFIVKGGVIMIPIGILFAIAVFIFFERLIIILKANREDHNFMHNIGDAISNMKLESAMTLCKSLNTPVSRTIEKGLSRIGRPIDEIERTLESSGRFEVSKLERNLKILGIVAGIAPMLGFIGTIMGVIKIFYTISLTNNISIGGIADGLYVKMITSACGLIIGVLAYAGHQYLNILLDKVIFKMENSAIDFLDLLHKKA